MTSMQLFYYFDSTPLQKAGKLAAVTAEGQRSKTKEKIFENEEQRKRKTMKKTNRKRKKKKKRKREENNRKRFLSFFCQRIERQIDGGGLRATCLSCHFKQTPSTATKLKKQENWKKENNNKRLEEKEN